MFGRQVVGEAHATGWLILNLCPLDEWSFENWNSQFFRRPWIRISSATPGYQWLEQIQE